MVEVRRLTKASLTRVETAELSQVDALAELLRAHLTARATDIAAVHLHGASSSAVQQLVGELLENRLGFNQEVVLTPEDGLVVRPRPDFVYRFSNNRGIIAEVERGGTTTNNHDLKDMWKAHISRDTHHLFLIVPVNNWKLDGTPRSDRPYAAVCRRLAAFFGDARRELDVVSAHIFGY